MVSRPEFSAARRASLDFLLTQTKILQFDSRSAVAHRGIINVAGYAQSRLLDRMISTTAIALGHIMITANAAGFRYIPNLKLEVWKH